MRPTKTAYKNNFAMKKYLLLPALLIANALYAQVPEDVLKYSFFPQNGTARVVAIGGAMGSLGGDITANFVNPAGLGNYKTGEFVYTPGFYLNNNNVNFRDTKVKSKDNNFAFLGGPIGFVYGAPSAYKKNTSHAISLAVNQTTNYNNRIQYSGYNNYSSFSEQFAEKGVQALNKNGTIDDVLNDPAYAYDASPAFDTYLIDTFSGNTVKAMPEFVLAQGKALFQQSTIETSGGIYEVALGYAMNKNDKFLFGGSLGIPIVNYKSNSVFTETDTSADHANNFSTFTYTDDFSTKGVGINLKVGAIFKPSEYLRLGLAIHTPSYMFTLKDQREVNLDVNSENYKGARSVSSTRFTNGVPGQSEYSLATPWKMMISGSYVIREIENVAKQKGFITADIEYVGYKGSSFYSANPNPETAEIDYYKLLNQVIKDEYKGAFNFRVGGELKFNVIMTRLGFAYYTNPYKSLDFSASKMLLSGGLGYRNKGFFVDLTYVYSINKDVDFPYRLGDKANTFASINNQLSNIVASVGVKF
jgi:hypothetical protein